MEDVVLKEKLTVIVPYFNPTGSKRREQLRDEFMERMLHNTAIDVRLVMLRYPFELISSSGCIHVRANSIMFHKENLINIGLRYVPQDGKFAWIDADVAFA